MSKNWSKEHLKMSKKCLKNVLNMSKNWSKKHLKTSKNV